MESLDISQLVKFVGVQKLLSADSARLSYAVDWFYVFIKHEDEVCGGSVVVTCDILC